MMLSILGTVLGFASSAVPAITDSFARKQDNKHELDKMKAMAKVMKQAEELDTSGDSSTFTALLKNPQGAEKLAQVIEDSTTSVGEGDAVIDTDKLNVMFNVVKSKRLSQKRYDELLNRHRPRLNM